MKNREETKFKKITNLNLSNNFVEKPADIYLKVWDSLKSIRDLLPNSKIRVNEIRTASNKAAGKIFASAVGNLKEIQDIIEIIERINLSDSNSEEYFKKYEESPGLHSEKNTEKKLEKQNSKKNFKNPKNLNIMEMYNAKGEFKPVNIENMINDGFDN